MISPPIVRSYAVTPRAEADFAEYFHQSRACRMISSRRPPPLLLRYFADRDTEQKEIKRGRRTLSVPPCLLLEIKMAKALGLTFERPGYRAVITYLLSP